MQGLEANISEHKNSHTTCCGGRGVGKRVVKLLAIVVLARETNRGCAMDGEVNLRCIWRRELAVGGACRPACAAFAVARRGKGK
jgi:hypothetical protein